MTNKPFNIPQNQFKRAFKEVKDNRGTAGVDEQTIEDFSDNLNDNLYKLWNRMCSGTYFPKAVKLVLIPKKNGKKRPLGIPTVTDRVAQTIVKNAIEPRLERIFVTDSFGYRPNKSAKDAISTTRKRCWQYDWVLEFDIVGLFDNINHGLLFKAVDRHIEERWIRLYLKRWCKAPMVDEDGNIQERSKGVSQGGVTSPLLANLFMHYAFDKWMQRTNPQCLYERYADDAVIHCHTKRQALEVLKSLDTRLKECGLELHPEKTRIVYCKDSSRKSNNNDYKSFDFLGFTFRARKARNKKTGEYFTSFLPAISKDAAAKFREKINAVQLQSMTYLELDYIAKVLNPIIRGWMNYYGSFYPSEMRKTLRFLNAKLCNWARHKYKGMKSMRRSNEWFEGVVSRQPKLFYHWTKGYIY